jgi:hypothetical protein
LKENTIRAIGRAYGADSEWIKRTWQPRKKFGDSEFVVARPASATYCKPLMVAGAWTYQNDEDGELDEEDEAVVETPCKEATKKRKKEGEVDDHSPEVSPPKKKSKGRRTPSESIVDEEDEAVVETPESIVQGPEVVEAGMFLLH